MNTRFLCLALCASMACIGTAQIYDSTPGNSFTDRAAENAPALHILNTNGFAVNLGRVEFWGDLKRSVESVKFFLADASGTVLSATTLTMNDIGVGLYGTDVNWTLNTGSTYYISAITQGDGAFFGYDTTFDTQNGIESLANGNFNGFASPNYIGDAGARMAWKLYSPVPEPATMLVLASGLALATRRRRKK